MERAAEIRRPPGSIKKNVTSQTPKSNQNGNILNFFTKISYQSCPTGNTDQGLFIQDLGFTGTEDNGVVATGHESIVEDDSETFGLEPNAQIHDRSRFNESPTSVKRRKVSGNQGENFATTGECTPPPEDFNNEANPHNPLESRISEQNSARAHSRPRYDPFLDDSDEEHGPETTTLNNHMSGNDISTVGTQIFEQDVSTQNKVFQDDFAHEAEKPDGNKPVEMLKTLPNLQHEPSSTMDMEVYEGMEDIEDEYEGGEEFLERKYMEEQQKLELESEIELANTEDFQIQMSKGPQTNLESVPEEQRCPICDIELSGIDEQDVMVHVNNCLDGNPTPLPQRQQQSESSATQKAPSSDTKGVGSTAAQFKRPVRPAKPGQQTPFTLVAHSPSASAFTKLMSGHAEDEAWQSAAAAEHAARGKPAYQRTCPFYKILPGFFICVDAFRYGAVQGCNAYFLSHFHSDHYVGLTSTWSHGPIYCSKPTANLVKQQLRVDSQFVVPLEFEKRVEVPRTQGVHVTMIPANHCPGSSLFLFEKAISSEPKPRMQRVLHCGDFRACPAHIEHPLLKPEVRDAVTESTSQQRIDVCYLDTTYLNPKYAFPSQEDVIQACADMCVSLNKSKVDPGDEYETMKRERAGNAMASFLKKENSNEYLENGSAECIQDNAEGQASILNKDAESAERGTSPVKTSKRGRLLVIVGTYSIGKERICLGIARALRTKIYAPQNKQRIARALEDPELNALLTSDPAEGQVHMTPLFDIRAETLGEYLTEYRQHFDRAIGFRPSGWTYRPPGSRFTESPSVDMVLYSDSWKSSYTMRDLVPQRGSTSRAACYGVPYSEHSSFRELTMFCCALRIDKIIPTVNIGNAKSRERMKVWCERWAAEKRKNGLFRLAARDNPDPSHHWYAGKGTWELRTTL